MPFKNKEAQKEYQRRWMANRRYQWFESKGGKCIRCGSKEKLQVDHIDPKKKVTHRVWTWSADRRKAELAKCQVLCYECHKKKTKMDFNYGLKHGTVTGYNSYRCRCRPCTDAVVRSNNEYRWRTGKRKRRIIQTSLF